MSIKNEELKVKVTIQKALTTWILFEYIMMKNKNVCMYACAMCNENYDYLDQK